MKILVFIDGLLVPNRNIHRVEHRQGFYDGDQVFLTLPKALANHRDLEALVFSEDGLLKARCKYRRGPTEVEDIGGTKALEYELD